MTSGAIDPQREQLVRNRLREHGLLDIANLEVRVRQDVAYVEGSVPNLRQKRLAGETSAQVEGIREVVNRLRIAPSPVVDDDTVRKRITRALARNPRINEAKVSVEVTNGTVHLGGFVSTAAGKRLAEDEAWAAPGVRDIINKIEVLSAAPKSDIQIAGEIMEGFSSCLGLDLSKVTVELADGVVRLQGMVPSDYLKSAAEELARWTPSVAEVVNELQVLSWPGSSGSSRPGRAKVPREDCWVNTETSGSESASATQYSGQAAERRSSPFVSKTASQQ